MAWSYGLYSPMYSPHMGGRLMGPLGIGLLSSSLIFLLLLVPPIWHIPMWGLRNVYQMRSSSLKIGLDPTVDPHRDQDPTVDLHKICDPTLDLHKICDLTLDLYQICNLTPKSNHLTKKRPAFVISSSSVGRL